MVSIRRDSVISSDTVRVPLLVNASKSQFVENLRISDICWLGGNILGWWLPLYCTHPTHCLLKMCFIAVRRELHGRVLMLHIWYILKSQHWLWLISISRHVQWEMFERVQTQWQYRQSVTTVKILQSQQKDRNEPTINNKLGFMVQCRNAAKEDILTFSSSKIGLEILPSPPSEHSLNELLHYDRRKEDVECWQRGNISDRGEMQTARQGWDWHLSFTSYNLLAKIHCDMTGRAQLVLTQSLYRSNAFFEGSQSGSCTDSDSQKLIRCLTVFC